MRTAADTDIAVVAGIAAEAVYKVVVVPVADTAVEREPFAGLERAAVVEQAVPFVGAAAFVGATRSSSRMTGRISWYHQ